MSPRIVTKREDGFNDDLSYTELCERIAKNFQKRMNFLLNRTSTQDKQWPAPRPQFPGSYKLYTEAFALTDTILNDIRKYPEHQDVWTNVLDVEELDLSSVVLTTFVTRLRENVEDRFYYLSLTSTMNTTTNTSQPTQRAKRSAEDLDPDFVEIFPKKAKRVYIEIEDDETDTASSGDNTSPTDSAGETKNQTVEAVDPSNQEPTALSSVESISTNVSHMSTGLSYKAEQESIIAKAKLCGWEVITTDNGVIINWTSSNHTDMEFEYEDDPILANWY